MLNNNNSGDYPLVDADDHHSNDIELSVKSSENVNHSNVDNYKPIDKNTLIVYGLMFLVLGLYYFIKTDVEPVVSGESSNLSSNEVPYILALTWKIGFCNTYKKCYSVYDADITNHNFGIHGLWPQFSEENNGKLYPQFCNKENFDKNELHSVDYDRMVREWPNLNVKQDDVYSSAYSSFWAYEWKKHGTCSGLSQNEYFKDALSIYEKLDLPNLIDNYVPGVSANIDMSAYVIRSRLGKQGPIYLKCGSNGKVLLEVQTCWEGINSNNKHKTQIVCPEYVQDTCSSEMITIA